MAAIKQQQQQLNQHELYGTVDPGFYNDQRIAPQKITSASRSHAIVGQQFGSARKSSKHSAKEVYINLNLFLFNQLVVVDSFERG